MMAGGIRQLNAVFVNDAMRCIFVVKPVTTSAILPFIVSSAKSFRLFLFYNN